MKDVNVRLSLVKTVDRYFFDQPEYLPLLGRTFTGVYDKFSHFLPRDQPPISERLKEINPDVFTTLVLISTNKLSPAGE